MNELTPSIFEDIFFTHIRAMTVGDNDDMLRRRLASFDYQFSDHRLHQDCKRRRPLRGEAL